MKKRLDYARAKSLAEKIADELRPACERIEIAGSLRRRQTYAGDLELVAIPRKPPQLFDDINPHAPTLLDSLLAKLMREGRFKARTRKGPRYKQFLLLNPDGFQLDLFCTDPDCWPVIYAIRTGSADFSRSLVTPRASGGLLQNGCRVSDGRLWQEEQAVDLRDERHLFEFVQGGWREPEERQ